MRRPLRLQMMDGGTVPDPGETAVDTFDGCFGGIYPGVIAFIPYALYRYPAAIPKIRPIKIYKVNLFLCIGPWLRR